MPLSLLGRRNNITFYIVTGIQVYKVVVTGEKQSQHSLALDLGGIGLGFYNSLALAFDWIGLEFDNTKKDHVTSFNIGIVAF